MLQLFTNIKKTYQFRTHGIHRFGPKFSFQFEAGPYLVKTAESIDDLIGCFELRNEVFNKEFRQLHHLNYDFDQFDSKSDHIIIIHKESRKIVGTYRLNSTLFSKKFYTQIEFEIPTFNVFSGPILELGRACIQKDHRRGIVITLLWKGIAEYMNLSKAQTLLGCSSIKVSDSRDAALIFQYLSTQGHLYTVFGAKPTAPYEMENFATWYEYFSANFSQALAEEAESMLPSLLKSYLKLGAKIIAEPAYDEDFNCIDLLTMLKRDHLASSAGKKLGIA